MNLEQLDGFLAALVCGPDNVSPSEYLPEIWGGDIVLEDTFTAQPLVEEVLSLIMRHWNSIVDTLGSGDVHLPLLLKDESGIALPTIGQMVSYVEWTYAKDWADLLDDEERCGSAWADTTRTRRCVRTRAD
jgi:uncharacterized protein